MIDDNGCLGLKFGLLVYGAALHGVQVCCFVFGRLGYGVCCL